MTWDQDTRVLVTGVGAVTPVGDDAPSTWDALLAGRSGVVRLDNDWVEGLTVQIAGTVKTDPGERLDRVEARNLDRSQRLALLAFREAWEDAGKPECDPDRLAVVVGSGVGGVLTLLAQYDNLKEKGPRRVSPFTVPMMMPNGPAAVIGIELGARGSVRTTVSACSSGAEAIALGLDLLRMGRVDVVVAGGTEAAIHELPMAGFGQMRALSTRNDEPEKASRPWDAERDGFVLGEGAGIVVLETEAHAVARGAKVYAELAGAGVTSDAHHITAPEPSGIGATKAMIIALEEGGIASDEIDYINAHGTSTPVGDVAEIEAIKSTFGPHARALAISSTKSMTGHLLGAAGAMEAVVTVLSIRDGKIHPTINRDKPDEKCDLDVVPEGARDLVVRAALSNSFGFGGHNVSLAFKAYQQA